MKRMFLILLSVAMLMVFMTACSKQGEPNGSASSAPSEVVDGTVAPSGETTGSYQIACIYGSITGDYWSIVKSGADAALAELKASGVTGYVVAPSSGTDYTQQMDLLDVAMLDKVDGIVLSCSNADSIGTYVTDNFTDDVAIPIIAIDKSLTTSSKWVVGQYMSDTYAMGYDAGKLAEAAMGGEGKYVLLGLSPENESWANRSYGAKDYLDEKTDMTMAADIFWQSLNTDDQYIGFVTDTALLNAGEKLVFLTTSEGGTNQTIAALGTLGEETTKNFQVIGFDFSELSYNFMKSGDLYGTVGQNPFLMGYDSVYLMVDYLEGKDVPEANVPYCVVTKDNMETEEVKDYIASMGLTV